MGAQCQVWWDFPALDCIKVNHFDSWSDFKIQTNGRKCQCWRLSISIKSHLEKLWLMISFCQEGFYVSLL